MIGKNLSHYKVLEKIGQGGMGEVYRAEDTNLDREVAIKVLPEQFTQDPQRLARFEREAKLLASLNHPNIAAIYGFEKAEGVHFLAMELVPGETLAERVAKGPLPVEEALEVCRQIAEGVEAAHEKGVIHRDLKPANVKVTPEGKVKILDFGLAKAFEEEVAEADISQSPTLTEEMTRAGVILGTAAYMSPEQAKGKPVDKRADVFAFGALLFELLTGKRAFEGETITETIAKVLESEPKWEALPGDTPWNIHNLLRRCLQKGANDRLHHVADVRIEIQAARTDPTPLSPLGMPGAVKPSRWRPSIMVSLAILAVVTTTIAIWSLAIRSPRVVTPEPVTHFVFTPPATAPIKNNQLPDVAISPDGRHIVYATSRRGFPGFLYVRHMDEVTATPIPGTENADFPFFSPDGDSVAFISADQLMRVSLEGGAVIKLCDVQFPFRGGHWGSVDTIVFAGDLGAGTGLYRVSANGGQPESLVLPDSDKGETAYARPWILPDGNDVLFTVLLKDSSSSLAVLSLQTRKQKILLEGVRAARYAPTGHLVYETGTRTLMAVPFDLVTLEVSGDPTPIVQEIRPFDNSFSADGTLIYIPGGARAVVGTPVWVDRDGGDVESIVEDPIELPRFPRLSPDGRRLALTTGPDGSGNLWVYDLSGRPPYRLTTEGHSINPVWTPDSKRVAFAYTPGIYTGSPPNLFWMPADGSTSHAEPLAPPSPNRQFPGSWSPDGRELIFVETFVNEIRVLSIEDQESSSAEVPYLFADNVSSRVARLSPNGKLVAYVSDTTGGDEIWVRPYAGPDAPFRISPNGGVEPVWSPDGRELFYLQANKMMAVQINTELDVRFDPPEVLFEGSYDRNFYPSYDVGLDGRFLMIKGDEQESGQPQIHVILNWFEELKRLAPTN